MSQRCLSHLRTGLVSGTVSYQPEPLESPGPGNAYLCCSPEHRRGARPLTSDAAPNTNLSRQRRQ